VTLPVTFGTKENYRTEYIKFEVADFEPSCHAILGRPALAKFMAVPHYVYLVLKMLGKTGVLTFRGDLKKSYDCDHEAIEYPLTTCVPEPSTEVFTAPKQLSQLKMEIPTIHQQRKLSQSTVKPNTSDNGLKTIQLQDGDPSKTALIGAWLDVKYESTLINFLRANRDIFMWKLADMPGVLSVFHSPSSKFNAALLRGLVANSQRQVWGCVLRIPHVQMLDA
jgi:hypothetical protein